MNILKTLFLLFVLCSSICAQGTFTLGVPVTNGCPTGFTCTNFTVTAPGIPVYPTSGLGQMAIRTSSTGASGTIVFFSGSAGNAYWAIDPTLDDPFFDTLISQDYDIIQVKWLNAGWIGMKLGTVVGQSVLAQRPSTAIFWLAANRNRGARFIVAGSSNGSSQLTYSMAYYGAGSVINLAIPISGPPYMNIDLGCGQVIGYAYPTYAAQYVDSSYGYGSASLTGPCVTHDPSWFSFEAANSVEAGQTYNYPNTSVKVLLGAIDDLFIRNRGQDYYNLLVSSGQQNVTITFVPNQGHSFQQTQQGLNAILNAINSP